MNRLCKFAALLSLAASPTIAQAQATSACLTRAEANALFANTMPDLVEGMTKKCQALLPKSAFLPTQGAALVARYKAAPTADWALAKSGFVKMMGQEDDAASKMMAALPDEAVRALLGTAFGVAIAEKVKAKDCPMIDRFIGALSPLPPSNIATIVTELMLIGAKEEKDPLKICPEG